MADRPEPTLFSMHRPGAPLDRFVDSVWYWEGAPPQHPLERILPNGSATLVINLEEDEVRNYLSDDGGRIERFPGAVLVGAHSRYTVIDSAEQRAVMGVSFRPGGMWPFFDPAADELHNDHVPLSDVWGAWGATLRERLLLRRTPQERLRLLTSELLARAVRPLDRRVELQFALARLTQAPQERTIAALSDDVGLSPRRFTRIFTLEVGLTPKLFARIKRFEHMLRRTRGAQYEWSEVALECGYFDQSHLIRDCKALSGFTPRELIDRVFAGHHVRN